MQSWFINNSNTSPFYQILLRILLDDEISSDYFVFFRRLEWYTDRTEALNFLRQLKIRKERYLKKAGQK